MGLIKNIKKMLPLVLMLGAVAMTMSGCVYANNKSWHDMTPEERQEVRQEFENDKKHDLEADFPGNRLEEQFSQYILDRVEQALQNED